MVTHTLCHPKNGFPGVFGGFCDKKREKTKKKCVVIGVFMFLYCIQPMIGGI